MTTIGRLRKVLLAIVVGVVVSWGVVGGTGCARFRAQRGVEPRWRDAGVPAFEPGITTQSDVLAALGPPSQIIALHEGTVFYYLREITEGSALVLLLYNHVVQDVSYDRAVLFFDVDGVLTEVSISASTGVP